LRDPTIGDFETSVLIDEDTGTLREAIEGLFVDARREDLLVLHLSCHGIKLRGGLYFAASTTKRNRLSATAVSAAFIQEQMTHSASERIVLLLDCCYGGAWDRGGRPRAAEDADVIERFDGRGRVVITASSALGFAFEGDDFESMDEPSYFTGAVVRGLDSGDADLDEDGRVGLDELYEYVYDQVRSRRPDQTPEKSTYGMSGRLYIARRRTPVNRPAPLPVEIQQLIQSPLVGGRIGAIETLSGMLREPHQGRALAARQALEALTNDDSKRVAEAAVQALVAAPPPPAPASQSVMSSPGPIPVSQEARPKPTLYVEGQEISPPPPPAADPGEVPRASQSHPAGQGRPRPDEHLQPAGDRIEPPRPEPNVTGAGFQGGVPPRDGQARTRRGPESPPAAQPATSVPPLRLVRSLSIVLGPAAAVGIVVGIAALIPHMHVSSPSGLPIVLWMTAVILTLAGIVQVVRGALLFGIVLIVVGLLVGPGGVSIFT
jgi:hypothetical protein